MKRSQSDRIIDWLASGRSLTPLQALSRFGCMRLGARIWQLKRDGHRIQAEMVRRRGKTYARYRMEPWVVTYNSKWMVK